MLFVALIVTAMLVGVFRLTTRYDYGPKSQRLLTVVYVASLGLGLLLARYYFFTTARGFYLLLAAAGLSIPVFVALAVLTVEVMRKGRQAAFDREIEALEARERELGRTVDAMDREMRDRMRRDEATVRSQRQQDAELAEDRRRVEAWKHEGGAARIRSIKIDEWSGEFRELGPDQLARRRCDLRAELADAPPADRRAQLEVMLALLRLAETRDSVEAAVEGARGERPEVVDLAQRRREAEGELARVRDQLAAWRGRLREFLAREIRLD